MDSPSKFLHFFCEKACTAMTEPLEGDGGLN